jgi:hypothetical protein
LNSEEAFQNTLKEYQSNYPQDYQTEDDVADLKKNTGNWEYQGFADFSSCQGFDADSYHDHYNLGLDLDEGDSALALTDYALAMEAVLALLVKSQSFKNLKISDDFVSLRVEHNY